MVNMGTAEITVRGDTSRVLPVAEALAMMARLLVGYGHVWTSAERAQIEAAEHALKREHLAVEAG